MRIVVALLVAEAALGLAPAAFANDGGVPRAAPAAALAAPAVGHDGGAAPFLAGVARDGGASRSNAKKKPKRAGAKPAASVAVADGGVVAGKGNNKKAAHKTKKAIKALERVHEHSEKTLRRIGRVEEHLRRGDVSAAMRELDRAKRATHNAATAVEHFEQEEVLEPMDYVIRGAATAGIAVLAILLAIVLGFLLRRLLSRGPEGGILERSAAVRWSYRLILFSVTVGLLGVAAWLAITLVWHVRISPAQVVGVLEHPLFAFEGRPVTGLSMFFFVITLAVLFIVSRHIRGVLEKRMMPRFSTDIGVQQAFAAIFHYLIVFVGLLISLEVLGVGASTVAIVAGVVGIGVGFGMQHLVNNFLSGLVLIFERHVRVGDWVDVGHIEGRVVRIQWRGTTLVTRDNVTIVVPNADFVQGKVHNLTIPDNRLRARVKVGVSYDTDVDLLQRVLMEVADAHPKLLKEPAPQVRIVEFADSAMTAELLYWLGDLQGKENVASEVRFGILRAFRKHGIVIPFPVRDTRLLPTPELLQAWDERRPSDPNAGR